MSTLAFTPQQTSPPFAAVVTLDSAQYTLVAQWNVYAQRWYVSLTDSSGNVAWTGPLIGSADTPVPLAPGVFASSVIAYDESLAQFTVTP